MHKELHWLDQYTGGVIEGPEVLRNEGGRKKFLVSSLIEEAFRSSQLEGASSTRDRARAMILKKETPRSNSEKMILNNYSAMEYIKHVKDEELTLDLILYIHKVVTEGTLDHIEFEGALRSDNSVEVVDHRDGTVLHIPPDHSELVGRMKALCDFANNESDSLFVHPVIKAIALHFMIGYIHPFVDGNGRTARALFYWYCIKHGYWLFEYISISRIIKNAPMEYARAFLYTETDENDMTYFINHQLKIIKKATEDMIAYMQERAQETHELEIMLIQKNLKHFFNSRQMALLRHMFQNPRYTYSIYEHQSYHNVTYQTARNDLLKLSDELKLMKKIRVDSKSYIFMPHDDLKNRLEDLRKLKKER
jgi:Fic family protein